MIEVDSHIATQRISLGKGRGYLDVDLTMWGTSNYLAIGLYTDKHGPLRPKTGSIYFIWERI